MLDRILARLAALGRRLRRVERRELAVLGRWIQHTGNLLHLTVLVAVPLLIAVVTVVSNALTELSFLLFPPLAAGAYTLFSDPEGRYASPRKFVVGLVAGALCGWAALALPVAPAEPTVSPLSAALSIFFTGVVTWFLDVEEPAAFSTALLVLVTDDASPEAYVASVAVFGTLVAVVFGVWRSRFYERRARYLYDTAGSDDHVLVPIRGDPDVAETTAVFGATLAAAHDAGKVVLLAVLDGAEDGNAGSEPGSDPDAKWAAERLESVANTVRTRAGVPCEVVVARGPAVSTTVETAANTNCDLVVTPYEEDRGLRSPYVRSVFDSRYDTVAVRTTPGRRRWRRVLVMVSRPGDSAHAMLDFGSRLTGPTGGLSVCTCIDAEVERRGAEKRLADLAETVGVEVETRVARSDVTDFVAANAGTYDLLIVGSSGDRSRASRLLSPPTFEGLRDVDCDIAVVDRGNV